MSSRVCGWITWAALWLTGVAGQAAPVEVRSPDGRLAIAFAAGSQQQSAESFGSLQYWVTFEGKEVIRPSALCLHLEGHPPLGASVRIAAHRRSVIDETYTLVAGKNDRVRNHANALQIELEEEGASARRLIIEARAYNEAVAFRYLTPAQPALGEFRLRREQTEFRFPKDAFGYALVLPHFRSMYESEFLKLPVSALSNQGGVASNVLIGLPFLAELPGLAWVAITEAAIQGNPAMYLVNPSGSWTGHWLESRLAPHPRQEGLTTISSLPHASAWRVLLVAPHPGVFLESDVLTSLNPPSEISDFSWIQAGKSSWNWWSGSIGPDGKPAFSNETLKYYVDFSARAGFEYMLVDDGWSPRDNLLKPHDAVDIPALIRYARSKGVRIWLWAHWEAVDRQMEEAFALFEKWGVAGVKIDFMSRDDQEMIGWYYRVAKQAARHRLMVDFHGSTKPTGMERTWPNVMGYEAVLGMEQSKAGARDHPDLHVVLAFTRLLAGPMDYTPGGFSNVTRVDFQPRMERPMVMGTRAHHLAMYVVYFAPFQMVSDHPAAYEGQPEFEFIRRAPAAWDETRFLNGDPGEYITLARRRGREWYVGCMTNWAPRTVEIPLSFLAPGEHVAEIYSDAPGTAASPWKTAVLRRAVQASSVLRLELAPGGGAAIRIFPAAR